ncbi:hypothetical protein M9458_052244 [Cirrhinus mrigala]|uniref:Uncharacterized protein n=1 Tax=Cirrhinus mrigala TaxID=683832 RepID=A0ABD0MVF5_CIRMR
MSASERQKENQMRSKLTSSERPSANVTKRIKSGRPQTFDSERYKSDQIPTFSERPTANVAKRTYCGPKRMFATSGGRPLFAA